MSELQYQLFPRSFGIEEPIKRVIDCFKAHYEEFKSPAFTLQSNEVLKILEKDLKGIGFNVEESKADRDKIKVPVLFGINNEIDKFFDADAVSNDGRIIIEVEAGRAYSNNQFLKDLFQACMMHGVEYLVIAVRNDYRGNPDFRRIFDFFETLYINGRLVLPLKGIVLIGY